MFLLGNTEYSDPPFLDRIKHSKKFRLIGLSGPSGVGKDVVANYLAKKYGYVRLGFGDALKEELAQKFPRLLAIEATEMYGHQISIGQCTLDEAIYQLLWKQRTPRTRALLQEFGTDVRRADDLEYWTRRWCQKYLKTPGSICVPDLRQLNEKLTIKNFGGFVVKLIRPQIILDREHTHISDLALLDDNDWDAIIVNDSSYEVLIEQVEKVLWL